MARLESTWEIIRRELRGAPPLARRRVRLVAAGFLLLVIFAAVDAAGDRPGLEGYRLAAITLAGLAMAMLAVANVVRAAAEAGAAGEGAAPDPRPPALHRALVIVPFITLAAAVLLAYAAGMMIIPTIQAPIFVVAEVTLLATTFFTAREVTRVNRYLYQQADERARAAERAESEVADARLAALQAQMNPHFLFNALNTVASLVRTDPHAAESTVEHLADVLRRTLDRSRRTTATVRDEVEYLRAYLSLEEQRWGDALRVEWRIAPETLGLSIPVMTLQPLVENALKHGLGGRLEGGRVRIESARGDGALRLTVADDGVGVGADARDGLGLGNLRRRLGGLYGPSGTVDLRVEDGWTIARVEIPCES
jgi:sensor histidine kinase YesM